MTVPTQAEAVAELEAGRVMLNELVARMTPSQMEEPNTIGGGSWSAKDLIGHLSYWEELAIEALEAWREGRRPAVEDIFARDSDGVDEANAANAARTASQPVDDVLERAARTHDIVVSAIAAIGDEEWTQKAPYPIERRRKLAELLGGVLGMKDRPFGHAFAHEADLRARVDSL